MGNKMKEEDLLNLDNDGYDFDQSASLNRRDFLKHLGGGIFIFFAFRDSSLLQAQTRGRRVQYPTDFNAYLRVAEDGRVSCFTGKIEMGQGIITSLAQMLAEELEVPLDSVDMVMGDTALCPYDSSTTGSRSTKYFGPPLRRAAAEAKMVLLLLASERLQVPQNRLVLKNGIIKDKKNSKKQLTYAQIAKGEKIARHLKDKATITHYSKHKISGKEALRTDSLKKVTGEAKFAGDIRLPGMLYARVLRPPSHGAKLKKVDTKSAAGNKGIRLIQEKNLIAVLHEHPEEAKKAIKSVKADWEELKLDVDNKTIFKHLENAASSSRVIKKSGDLKKGAKRCSESFESTYFNHYVAHVPAETYTILVDAGENEVTAWASTQAPFRVRRDIAEFLKVPVEKVRVITPFVGGGFGGKKSGQQVLEAARLSRLMGRPVQLAWTREEEFFFDAFRPAAVIKVKSGIDESGKIVNWDFKIIYTGTRSSQPVYDIKNLRISASGSRGRGDAHPFNTGAWRGPGSNTNVFAMESQMDIMAQAAGLDPLSFRMKNLSDRRMQRLLRAAADKFGHSFSTGPSGKGYGLACTDYLGTYVATIAEVKADKKTGHIQVKRIVCAQDMGEIINPQGARLQIEGGLTMGLSSALKEEISFKGGTIHNKNFDSYEITRFSEAPQIDVVLVDNPEMAPQGCGEPAITTTGAVIANAVYDAIGIRMFELPMTPEKIKKALEKV